MSLIHKLRKNEVTPSLTKTPLKMRQWDLHKSKGELEKENPQYLFRIIWSKIVLEDELTKGDLLQIFPFRNGQDKLSMGLVKVDK